MSPRDILTAQYATANDPSSGGRQMQGHYGSHEHNLVSVSSPVATQLLHAVGIALAAKIRKTGQVAMTTMGEGSTRAMSTRASTSPRSTSCRSCSSSRTTGTRSASRRPARCRCRTSRTELLAMASRAWSSTATTCWPATSRRATRSSGHVPARSDAHRGQGHPAHGPLVRRPADQIPLGGGARRGAHEGLRAALPEAAPGRGHPDRRGRRAADRRDQASSMRRPTMPKHSLIPIRRRRPVTCSSRTSSDADQDLHRVGSRHPRR